MTLVRLCEETWEALIYRVHHAVILVIAQLSCLLRNWLGFFCWKQSLQILLVICFWCALKFNMHVNIIINVFLFSIVCCVFYLEFLANVYCTMAGNIVWWQSISCCSRSSMEQSSITCHCCPHSLSIFCFCLKSHLFSLYCTVFWLFSFIQRPSSDSSFLDTLMVLHLTYDTVGVAEDRGHWRTILFSKYCRLPTTEMEGTIKLRRLIIPRYSYAVLMRTSHANNAVR